MLNEIVVAHVYKESIVDAFSHNNFVIVVHVWCETHTVSESNENIFSRVRCNMLHSQKRVHTASLVCFQ